MVGGTERGHWKPRGTPLFLHLAPQINLITSPHSPLWVSWDAFLVTLQEPHFQSQQLTSPEPLNMMKHLSRK